MVDMAAHDLSLPWKGRGPKGWCFLMVLDSLSTFDVVLMLKQRRCNFTKNATLDLFGAIDVMIKLVNASAISFPMAWRSNTSSLPRNV